MLLDSNSETHTTCRLIDDEKRLKYKSYLVSRINVMPHYVPMI